MGYPANRDRPRIVVLCGSTRFRDIFELANELETLKGKIVLAPGVFNMYGKPADKAKLTLDALHLRKIDMADEVYIINPGGYIGNSTRAEIGYAKRLGKPLIWLESES